jgi:hypothetical protein
MKTRLKQKIVSMKLYKRFVGRVLPHIRFSTAHNDICGAKYHEGYRVLKPGQIILSVDKEKLTTMLIPGEFSHAALCVAKGSDSPFEIAEMTHKNYTQSHFYDLCREADRVVLLECKAFDEPYVEKVIDKCLSYKDAPYDTRFDMEDDKLYCCELVLQSDFERRLDVDFDDTGLGHEYLSPDGLLNARNVEIVWDSGDPTTRDH